MARSISLLLGVHNHQPVDNWDHVIKDATQKCYQPFLDVLEAHPKVGMSVHYTGYLLDWLAHNHPDHIQQLRRLVNRGQIELLSGAFYEPILAIIPDADKIGQIQKLSHRVHDLTGGDPQGLWLAERVWEPHLVKPIAEAGIRYVMLDDSHFMASGLNEEELTGRFVTEEEGRTLDVFPVNQTLRYQIPYGQPEEVIDYLSTLASEDGNRCAVYFDDGEKFGVWPGSHKLVYTEKWLDRFFTLLEQNADWLHTTTPAKYMQRTRPVGRIYLPTASYSEMMEWALPSRHAHTYERGVKEVAPEYGRFLRAGFWRNFLVKYPEANNIHKKMLYVSEKIQRAEKLATTPAQKDIVADARNELWQGQSNDIFWHGVFGGLYLTNLRSANYQHLIKAENLVDAAARGEHFFEIHEQDFDCDGFQEILVETASQNLYFDPDEGGCLFELDYRPRAVNLLDTLARRHEAYHDKMTGHVDGGENFKVRNEELIKHLHYDWHRRVSLLDHFLGEGTTITGLSKSDYREVGDFVNQPYEAQHQNGRVIMERTGNLWLDGGAHPLHVRKVVVTPPEEAKAIITYTVTNLGSKPVSPWFAPEFNVNLLAPDAPDRYYYLPDVSSGRANVSRGLSGDVAVVEVPTKLENPKLKSRGTLEKLTAIGLRDEWLKVDYQLHFDKPCDLWRFPVQTISQSETGFEKVYQSSALFPNWRLTLQPQEQWSVTITQTIQSV